MHPIALTLTFLAHQGSNQAVRHWMPCVDHPQSRHAIELRLSVGRGAMAVGPGELVSVTPSPCGTRRQFTFKLALPTSPEQLAFAVGPFVVMPDAVRGSHITHLCPPGRLRCLRVTTAPFSSLLGVIEAMLATSLPVPGVPTYTQCFLPSQLAPNADAIQLCPGLTFLSETLLLDDHIGHEGVETHLVCADAVSRQFMGIFLAPATLADTWLASGLAGCCLAKVMRFVLGEQETQWRLAEEAAAVFAADDGTLPPLCSTSPSWRWGVRQATGHDVRRLLDWKAALVMRQTENRVGEEVFAKLLRGIMSRAVDAQRQLAATGATDAPLHLVGTAVGTATMAAAGPPHADAAPVHDAALAVFVATRTRDVAAAAVAAATAPGAPAAQATRLLATDPFMSACCQVGALDRGEVAAFAARHIKCRGTPTLSCATYYIKYRLTVFSNELQVALRMDGPPCALSAAEAALEASKVTGWVPSCGVRVHEVTATTDFVVSLGTALQALRTHKCFTRFQEGNIKKGGLIKRQPRTADGGAVGDDAVDSPVTWVRVDPGREWIAAINMLQAEAGWISQLAKDKDVCAQGEAVDALARCVLERGSYASVNALAARLEDEDTFCRVRASAGRALGASSTPATSLAGVDKLIRYYKDRYYDKTLGRPAANAFANLGEAAVARGCLEGLALARGTDGATPPEAVDLLLEVAHHPDDSGTSHDASGHTAAALRALATAVVSGRAALGAALALVDRHLARDRLMPSYHNAVTVAALHALAALTAQLRVSGSRSAVPEDAIAAARRVLHRYLLPGNAPAVRRAAANACVVLAMAVATGEQQGAAASHSGHCASPQALLSLLTEAVTRVREEHDPGMAALMLEDAHALLLSSLGTAASPAFLALPPPPGDASTGTIVPVANGNGALVPFEAPHHGDAQGGEMGARAQPAGPAQPPRIPLASASPAALHAISWLRSVVRDGAHVPWRLRHAAFGLLQVAGGSAPTLFVPGDVDEEGEDTPPPEIPLPPGESLPLEPAAADKFVVPQVKGAGGHGGSEPRRRARPRVTRVRDASDDEDDGEMHIDLSDGDGDTNEDDGDEEAPGTPTGGPRFTKSGRKIRRANAGVIAAAPAAAKAAVAAPLVPFGPRAKLVPAHALKGVPTRIKDFAKAAKAAGELNQHRTAALMALNQALFECVEAAVETAPERFDCFLTEVNFDKPSSKAMFYIHDYPTKVPAEEWRCVKDMLFTATSCEAEDMYQSAQSCLDDVARIAHAARLYHLPQGDDQPAGQYAQASIVEDADALVAAVAAQVATRQEELHQLEEATRTAVDDPLPEEEEEEEEEPEEPAPKKGKKGSKRKARDFEEEDEEEAGSDEEESDFEYDDDSGGEGTRRKRRRAHPGKASKGAASKKGKGPAPARAKVSVPRESKIPKRMLNAFAKARGAAIDDSRGADVARFELNKLLLAVLHAAAPLPAEGAADDYLLFREPVNAEHPELGRKGWFFVNDYAQYVPPSNRCSLQEIEDRSLSPDPAELYPSAAAFLADVAKIRDAAVAYHGDGVTKPQPLRNYLAMRLPDAARALYTAVETELQRRQGAVQKLEAAMADGRMPDLTEPATAGPGEEDKPVLDDTLRYWDPKAAAAALRRAQAAFNAGEAAAKREGRSGEEARFALNRLLLKALKTVAPAGVGDAYVVFRVPVNSSRPDLSAKGWFYVSDYDSFVEPFQRCSLSEMQDKLLSGDPAGLYASREAFMNDINLIVDAADAYNVGTDYAGAHADPAIADAAADLKVALKAELDRHADEIARLEAGIEAGIEAGDDIGGRHTEGPADAPAPFKRIAFKLKPETEVQPSAPAALPEVEMRDAEEPVAEALPKFKFKFGAAAPPVAEPSAPAAPADDAAEKERKRLKKEAKRAKKAAERMTAAATDPSAAAPSAGVTGEPLTGGYGEAWDEQGAGGYGYAEEGDAYAAYDDADEAVM